MSVLEQIKKLQAQADAIATVAAFSSENPRIDKLSQDEKESEYRRIYRATVWLLVKEWDTNKMLVELIVNHQINPRPTSGTFKPPKAEGQG